jgi:hypothetical protein
MKSEPGPPMTLSVERLVLRLRAPGRARSLPSPLSGTVPKRLERAAAQGLLAPYPAEEMTCWPVSTRVGNV